MSVLSRRIVQLEKVHGVAGQQRKFVCASFAFGTPEAERERFYRANGIDTDDDTNLIVSINKFGHPDFPPTLNYIQDLIR